MRLGLSNPANGRAVGPFGNSDTRNHSPLGWARQMTGPLARRIDTYPVGAREGLGQEPPPVGVMSVGVGVVAGSWVEKGLHGQAGLDRMGPRKRTVTGDLPSLTTVCCQSGRTLETVDKQT